jgi:alpha-galactosidase
MPSVKVACLGGGSWYYARALPDLVVSPGLAGSELVLYDIDSDKAQLMAHFGAHCAAEAGTGFRVRVTETLAEALDGADFAITSIGGAGASVGDVYRTGYHLEDILIPAKYGIYQIVGDTCGPAGMMMALRSVPIYMNICREMEKRCPKAVLLNHSNPMAVLCRAMHKFSGINVVGICHGVQEGIMEVAKALGVDAHELETRWVGTNHYHWFTRIYHRGQDVYPEVRRRLAPREHLQGRMMTQRLSNIYGYQIVYPFDDHILEFYPFLAQLTKGQPLPYELEPWVDFAMEHRASEPSAQERATGRQAYLAQYQRDLEVIPLPAERSDPLTGEGLGSLIEDIAGGQRRVYIVNIPNDGAVPNLPGYAVLEIEGISEAGGVRGVYMGEAPLVLEALLHRRIIWQELVADAAVKGDRNLALQALLIDDMAVRPELAEAMLDELLVASKAMLPQFI